MIPQSLYRILVPDAPRDRRTEADLYGDSLFSARAKSSPLLRGVAVQPGLQTPSLVSSHQGAIEQILFAFPRDAVADAHDAAAFRSVIGALRSGTEFVIVHHEGDESTIAQWISSAGHAPDKITYVPMPHYVSFTDWAEDAYVSLNDTSDGAHYLIEPWEFMRGGDALIADAVEEYTASRGSQAPLIFQGGNCLIGKDVWLLGSDYFVDSIDLLGGTRPPVPIPDGADPAAFVRQLFADYVDSNRRLLLVGTERPIPLKPSVGRKEGSTYIFDLPRDGVGTYQPIFHIDMLVTLFGPDQSGNPRAMVGSPRLANEALGTTSPFALDEVYDGIAESLVAHGFQVTRNPLVHLGTLGRSIQFGELRRLAAQPGSESLVPGVTDLHQAGAQDSDPVRIRTWHHVTWNNCLVENSTVHGDHVYMPTFGEGHPELAVLDEEMERLWESHGVQVHRLGDFSRFAARQGVVHCIKKYLRRGA